MRSAKMKPQSSAWKPIDDSIDYLEYARLMHESFGDELPASTLEEELHRELADSHPLKNSQFKALYYKEGNPNEFIYTSNHTLYPTISVHLTWRNEIDPMFPSLSVIDITSV